MKTHYVTSNFGTDNSSSPDKMLMLPRIHFPGILCDKSLPRVDRVYVKVGEGFLHLCILHTTYTPDRYVSHYGIHRPQSISTSPGIRNVHSHTL
jgi:hypothetical protein